MDQSPALPPSRLITLAAAADILGAKPWDVVRLIEADQIDSVLLVDVESVHRFQQQEAS